MRVALARALFIQPEFLLLDERELLISLCCIVFYCIAVAKATVVCKNVRATRQRASACFLFCKLVC